MNLNFGFTRKGSRLPGKIKRQVVSVRRSTVRSKAESQDKGIAYGCTTPDDELLGRLRNVKTGFANPKRKRPISKRKRYQKPWLNRAGGWDRAYFGVNGQGEG